MKILKNLGGMLYTLSSSSNKSFSRNHPSSLPSSHRPAVATNRSAMFARFFLLAAFVCAYNINDARAQQLAVKSNLLYDATATINLGGELVVGKKQSIDLSGNLNLWQFSGNKKMKHWMLQPEWRYWFCQPFMRSFIGVEVHTGQFNFGKMLPFGISVARTALSKYRYEGWAVGAGITYGYQWILGRRWNLEASIGLGYTYLDYNQANCDHCGQELGDGQNHYFGPTKAAISLIYIIK